MHVAVVTFGYLPLPHVSVKRPSFFARELARRGHTVTVVTLDWRSPMPARVADVAHAVTDGERRDGVTVVRLDPRRRLPSFDPTAVPRVTEPPIRVGVLRRAVTLWRLLRWGPFASWARDAAAALDLVHEAAPIDVVWAIHGDPSAHEAARTFAVGAGVPWVADFKDPWDLYYGGMARRIAHVATRRRLRSAACLTETAAAQALKDERTFGSAAHVVWSGYDASAMEAATAARDSDATVIAYLGTVNSQHDVQLLVRGWLRLRREHPAEESRLRLTIYSSSAEALTRAMDDAGLGSRVVRHQPVGEREAFAAMRSASALLLFPTRRHFTIGVKELEYIASGSPVVALGRLHDEIAAVVRDGEQVLEALDETAVAETLRRLVRGESPPARVAVNHPAVARFDWARQADLLERVLAAAACREAGSATDSATPLHARASDQ